MLFLLFYTINNAVLLLWAALFCFRKPTKSKNLIFIMLSFGQLFILMSFREGIGFDYNQYASGFYNMKQAGFETLSYKDWEIGFIIFTKLFGFIPGMDHQWFIIVLSLIAIIPAAVFIYKNSEMPWVSTILYVNLFMFFMSMNFLRQMIAVSLLLLAWHFMKRKKFIIYAVIIVFASLFHQTVLIMLPVYFLVKMKPAMKEILIYGFILLWFYTASTNMIELVTSFYHEEYSETEFITEGVSFIYAITPLFITVVSFILVKTETINLTDENKYMINLSFICSLLMLTMSKHSIIERLSYYFIMFAILLVPVICKSLRKKGISYTTSDGKTINLTSEKSRILLSGGFLAIVLILSYTHFYYGLAENAHGAANYHSWLGFLP